MGKARQSRVNSLGLASLNNPGRLWAIGVVSCCLLPGPGMIWARGNTDLVCELDRVGSWGIGWFASERRAPSLALCYM